MKNKKYLLIYPIVIFFDVFEIIFKLVSNILYRLKIRKYNYNDIVAIEYTSFCLSDDESIIIYNENLYKIQDCKYDKVVRLNNRNFEKVLKKLKQNKILKYNYIFSFYITPINDLCATDIGIGEEVLNIFFKNNKKHTINNNYNPNIISNVISYIKSI